MRASTRFGKAISRECGRLSGPANKTPLQFRSEHIAVAAAEPRTLTYDGGKERPIPISAGPPPSNRLDALFVSARTMP